MASWLAGRGGEFAADNEIEVALIGDAASAPSGAGETALIAAVPALVNALRDASGFRATRLPLRFDDLPAPTP